MAKNRNKQKRQHRRNKRHNNNKNQKMVIDLSAASDDGLALILQRVPVKDLIGKCTQVSPQWNRILSENYFWRKKMEYDSYILEWPMLKDLSTKSFKSMALKHCFNRNFINDVWNFDEPNLTFDPRWDQNDVVLERADAYGELVDRIEIPPLFIYGEPEIPPGYEKPIACVAIGFRYIRKLIVIKLADEGLTDQIMDNFRPTIVVSEMVGNSRDCAVVYAMKCYLNDSDDIESNRDFFYFPEDDKRELQNEERDENSRWVEATIALRFKQSEAEGWHPMEYAFKDYPIGMRYLILDCVGAFSDIDQNEEGYYGLKLANCSVKALCEKNFQ